MKIECENADFEKDMQDLVNLFYKEEDLPFSLKHTFSLEGNTLTSVIETGSGSDAKENTQTFILPNTTPLLQKSLMKRHFKNHLYDVLSKISKKSLPWGSLTGVRPTKFARDMIDNGLIKEHLRRCFW